MVYPLFGSLRWSVEVGLAVDATALLWVYCWVSFLVLLW